MKFVVACAVLLCGFTAFADDGIAPSNDSVQESPQATVDTSDDSTAETLREPASAVVQPQAGRPQRPPQRVLSAQDQKLMQRGPIPQGRYIAGGITGSIVGFGIGHAIQGAGRYRDRGWIFTAGEGGSLALMMVGIFQCLGDSRYDDHRSRCDRGAAISAVGVVGFIGFHIWEIVDLWVAPPRINRRYEQLTHMNERRVSYRIAPTMMSETAPGLALAVSF